MTSAQIQEVFRQAMLEHQAGRLQQAEPLYRQILAADPRHADAYHLLGVIAHQVGRGDVAVELINRAIAIHPLAADFLNNLGLALFSLGRGDEAITAYLRALTLDPAHLESQSNLGLVLHHQGKYEEAINWFRKVILIAPQNPQSYINLGNSQQEIGLVDAAIASFHKALFLDPGASGAYFNLGNALGKKGEPAQAIVAYQKAISLNANDPNAYVNLSNVLLENDQVSQSIVAVRRAIVLKPDLAEAHNSLGNAIQQQGDMQAAADSYHRALELRPHYSAAANNLANALKEMGNAPEALKYYDQALSVEPNNADMHSNRIYCMHFDPAFNTPAICAELSRWNQRHAAPLANFIQPHRNARDPERRLRIGYVSPDFREHVVGWNLLPLLRCHDQNQIEIYCYSRLLRPDAMTAKLQSTANVWRDMAGVSTARAADVIRQDEIDILVDLSLHSANPALQLFGHKPAPIAVTYLGYCGSTGLNAIDYRFSDPYLDPPQMDHFYSEKTLRLPHTYWCYQPGGDTPEPGPLPHLANGYITFGCLNNFAKVSQSARTLWSEILASMPNSHLILHAQQGSHRQQLLDQFAAQGISPSRIQFVGKTKFPEYISTYQQIDVALDPFPYGGGITTCDGLWMGVPLITLDGKTAVGRGGKSILGNLGLEEFVARSPEQYLEMAKNLAANPKHLVSLRGGLREKMRSSPLMNASQFAKDVEAAYRRMWRDWCAG